MLDLSYMKYINWSEDDLEDLDYKFDALCEHLGVEFVFERICDGSDVADRERCYCREKEDKGKPFFGWDFASKNSKDKSVMVLMRAMKDGTIKFEDIKEI